MLRYTDNGHSHFSMRVLRLELKFYIIFTCQGKQGLNTIQVGIVHLLEQRDILTIFLSV